jgi:hypothetical protein
MRRCRWRKPKPAPASPPDRAVQEGVQMHGGIGVTDELDLGLFMKRGGCYKNCSAMRPARWIARP